MCGVGLVWRSKNCEAEVREGAGERTVEQGSRPYNIKFTLISSKSLNKIAWSRVTMTF